MAVPPEANARVENACASLDSPEVTALAPHPMSLASRQTGNSATVTELASVERAGLSQFDPIAFSNVGLLRLAWIYKTSFCEIFRGPTWTVPRASEKYSDDTHRYELNLLSPLPTRCNANSTFRGPTCEDCPTCTETCKK